MVTMKNKNNNFCKQGINRYEKNRIKKKLENINDYLKEKGLMLDSVRLTLVDKNKKGFILHLP